MTIQNFASFENSTTVPFLPQSLPARTSRQEYLSKAPRGVYPRHLEERRRLAGGAPVFLRPIRQADAPGLRAGFKRLSLEDVRHRFFLPMKSLSPALAEQLCDVDYDRHMALVALDGARGEDGEGLGVARYVADPDGKSAEFAIAVRSDRQCRGIGRLLLDRLLALARRRGVQEIRGEVLADNHAMLTLARRLDFRISRSPEDATVLLITKAIDA